MRGPSIRPGLGCSPPTPPIPAKYVCKPPHEPPVVERPIRTPLGPLQRMLSWHVCRRLRIYTPPSRPYALQLKPTHPPHAVRAGDHALRRSPGPRAADRRPSLEPLQAGRMSSDGANRWSLWVVCVLLSWFRDRTTHPRTTAHPSDQRGASAGTDRAPYWRVVWDTGNKYAGVYPWFCSWCWATNEPFHELA